MLYNFHEYWLYNIAEEIVKKLLAMVTKII